jgi:hypothetical protein
LDLLHQGDGNLMRRTTMAGSGSRESVLLWGASSVAALTADRYLLPGSGAAPASATLIQVTMPASGILHDMRVLHNSPAGNGQNLVYTLRVNGVASGLAVTLASTSSAGSDLTNRISVQAGDVVDVKVTRSVSIGASPVNIVVSVGFLT